jgi:RNA-binding protein Luc7-like 2
MRKQLDALMGTDRNGEPTLKKNFTDNDVCTAFLVGLCPHELFNNTVFYFTTQ